MWSKTRQILEGYLDPAMTEADCLKKNAFCQTDDT